MSFPEPIPACSVQPASPAAYDVVVIGGSAGGIPALIHLLSALPADFPLPLLAVQHLPPDAPSLLPQALGWRSRLPVVWAEDGARMQPGVVQVAPPDRHLVVRPGGRVGLSDAPRAGWWRPSVDVLFRSAAEVHGARTIAVVLSGMMWDGAAGIASVVRQGGMTIVQHETGCGHFDMPAAALDLGGADVALTPPQIARALQVLAGETRAAA